TGGCSGPGRRRWPPPSGSTTSTGASKGSARSPGCATTPATRSCSCGCTPAWSTASWSCTAPPAARVTPPARQAFHEESMVSAELLRLPRERIPPTVPALRAYLDEVMASGLLGLTAGARRGAELIGAPPGDVPRRPLWGLIGFLAFQTLPPPLRRLYGVRGGPGRQALVRASAGGRRAALPLPARALG